MMFKLNELCAAVAACTALASAGAVQAGPLQNFNLFDRTGTLLTPAAGGETAFELNEAGSGVAKGVGPFGTPLTEGSSFEFLYQANVNGLTTNGAPAGMKTVSNGGVFNPVLGGANSFEFTTVARFSETVDAVVGNTAVLSVNGGEPRKISIFYDDFATGGTPASTLAGTGFDDGIEIARFTIDPTVSFSNFTANPASGTGAGGTSFHATLSQADDFVNDAFLQGLISFVFDLHFDGNQNFPPGTSFTTAFHGSGPALACTGAAADCYPTYAVAGDDLLLKVDGAARTSFAVPEPGSLLLFGGALIGLAASRRSRDEKQA